MPSEEFKKSESIIEDEDNNIFEECPACGSLWGCEEFDFQECDTCGYPNNDDEDIDERFDGAEYRDDNYEYEG